MGIGLDRGGFFLGGLGGFFSMALEEYSDFLFYFFFFSLWERESGLVLLTTGNSKVEQISILHFCLPS